MNPRHHAPGFFKRLVVWLNRPFRYKLYSVAVRIFRVARKIDSEIIRNAEFDALDPAREFSIATYGPEKYVVINTDKAISKILFVTGSFDFEKVEKVVAIIRNQNDNFRSDTLIDVGANIGTVCIPAIKRGFVTHAIAIEPERLNYRVLVVSRRPNGTSASDRFC